MFLGDYVSLILHCGERRADVRIFICISNKTSILFEQFVTWQEAKRATSFSALFFLRSYKYYLCHCPWEGGDDFLALWVTECLVPHSCIRLISRLSCHPGTLLTNPVLLRELPLSEGELQTTCGLATGLCGLGVSSPCLEILPQLHPNSKDRVREGLLVECLFVLCCLARLSNF